MQPFLKWAGGKRWLFESKQYELPEFNGVYLEPFLGGGAVFFQTEPKKSVLSDANPNLIETYQAIKHCPEKVISELKVHQKKHSKEYYYKVRASKPRAQHTRAAKFIYLNRTCWNGLYRENKKGEFNVPIGTKDTVLFDSDNFHLWSEALQNSSLENCDFEETINKAQIGVFIFADPPYTVKHNMNGFVKYNQCIFAWEDQVRLRDSLVRACNRGASFALTNADHESVRELYSGFTNHKKLYRHSVISGQAKFRSQSTELLVVGTPARTSQAAGVIAHTQAVTQPENNELIEA